MTQTSSQKTVTAEQAPLLSALAAADELHWAFLSGEELSGLTRDEIQQASSTGREAEDNAVLAPGMTWEGNAVYRTAGRGWTVTPDGEVEIQVTGFAEGLNQEAVHVRLSGETGVLTVQGEVVLPAHLSRMRRYLRALSGVHPAAAQAAQALSEWDASAEDNAEQHLAAQLDELHTPDNRRVAQALKALARRWQVNPLEPHTLEVNTRLRELAGALAGEA